MKWEKVRRLVVPKEMTVRKILIYSGELDPVLASSRPCELHHGRVRRCERRATRDRGLLLKQTSY